MDVMRPSGSTTPRLTTASTEIVDDVERVTVTITVVGVEQVHGKGSLIGLAIVELDIAGVVLTLQGVQVLRSPDGSLTCRSPQFRRSNGMWTSAAVLPPDLAEALGAEVLAHLRGPRALWKG